MKRSDLGHFKPNRIVTFLSDFGLRDSYVAEVKGSMLALVRDLTIVDVTHNVPPQNIRVGAFYLMRAVSIFPAGTVHLAVVDPGVGSDRRPVVVRTASGHVLVGPDNGLLSWAAGKKAHWREFARWDLVPKPASRTFHGRDLFGPVSALIASALLEPESSGPVVRDPKLFPEIQYKKGRGAVSGEVLVIDHFGNIIVGVPGKLLKLKDGTPVTITTGKAEFKGIVGLYECDAPLVVHEDSSGWLEIASPSASANGLLGVREGERVTIKWS